MSKYGLGLARSAGLRRKQLIVFALLSAVINGLVTAGVGAWLAQTYATYQKKTAAIQTISDLVYERRARAGMVVYAVRRNAELDELRYRKRAYDEAFVNWNKKVQHNVFMIRDISGEGGVTRLETQFQEMLVAALADTDRCLTKAYDARIKGEDGTPTLEACRMAELHQFTLDCAATITNELDRLTRLSFLPWSGATTAHRKSAEARIDKGCTRPVVLNAPAPVATAAPRGSAGPGSPDATPAPSPPVVREAAPPVATQPQSIPATGPGTPAPTPDPAK